MADKSGREPRTERVIGEGHGKQISWAEARKRLEDPEFQRTYWLATVNPDCSPHVMPVIGLWQNDVLYFVAGEKTRKGRNLAADGRSTIAASSSTLPSVDLIMEGEARRVDDEAEVQSVADAYRTALEWPFEVRDGRLYGPNAPSAGPAPYAFWAFNPGSVFALPSLAGTESTTREERINAIRWSF